MKGLAADRFRLRVVDEREGGVQVLLLLWVHLVRVRGVRTGERRGLRGGNRPVGCRVQFADLDLDLGWGLTERNLIGTWRGA